MLIREQEKKANMKKNLCNFLIILSFLGVILFFHILIYALVYWVTGQVQFESVDTFISPP